MAQLILCNSKPAENKKDQVEEEGNFIENIEKSIMLLKQINVTYNQIFNSLKDNLELIDKFIEQTINCSENIGKRNPVQIFFSEEFNNIVDCWLFMKIDFGKFDVTEALKKTNLDQDFKIFINKISKNKNLSINVICPKVESSDQNEQKKLKEKKDEQIKLISENKSNIVKLHFENAGNITRYTGDKTEFDKLKKLHIENSEIQNGELFKNSKNLERLTIKSCPNASDKLLEFLPHFS